MYYLVLFGIIFISAIASFIIGWFWYSKRFFGDIWKREIGFSNDSGGNNKIAMFKSMSIGFLADLVKAFCLLFLTFALGINQFFLSLLIWVGFIIPPVLSSVLYEKRSWTLFFISSGYQLVSLMAISFILYLI